MFHALDQLMSGKLDESGWTGDRGQHDYPHVVDEDDKVYVATANR